MSKNNKKNESLDKIIDLCSIYNIEGSESYLKFLNDKINFYQNKIYFLENNKPFFFQKKKLIEYNNKLEEYNNKISDLYKQMGEETELIIKMQEQL